MRLILSFVIGNHRDPRFALNMEMDQMSVYFSVNSKRTLELIEKKTIHIRRSTNNTKRATVAVTISGNGTVPHGRVLFMGKAKRGAAFMAPLPPETKRTRPPQPITKSELRRKEPW